MWIKWREKKMNRTGREEVDGGKESGGKERWKSCVQANA